MPELQPEGKSEECRYLAQVMLICEAVEPLGRVGVGPSLADRGREGRPLEAFKGYACFWFIPSFLCFGIHPDVKSCHLILLAP